jgi:hypothetical protein
MKNKIFTIFLALILVLLTSSITTLAEPLPEKTTEKPLVIEKLEEKIVKPNLNPDGILYKILEFWLTLLFAIMMWIFISP